MKYFFTALIAFILITLFVIILFGSHTTQKEQQYILITTDDDYIITDLQTYANRVTANWNGSEIMAYGNFTVIEYKEGNK